MQACEMIPGVWVQGNEVPVVRAAVEQSALEYPDNEALSRLVGDIQCFDKGRTLPAGFVLPAALVATVANTLLEPTDLPELTLDPMAAFGVYGSVELDARSRRQLARKLLSTGRDSVYICELESGPYDA